MKATQKLPPLSETCQQMKTAPFGFANVVNNGRASRPDKMHRKGSQLNV